MNKKKILIKIVSCFLLAMMLVQYVSIGDSTNEMHQVEAASKTGTVKAYYLNMRKSASTKSKIIKILKKGARVTILKTGTNWYKIKYAGKTGYVKKGYISTGTASTSNKVVSSSVGTKGASIVSYAKKFVGNPYVWGGTSLTRGADCSGFTMSVYRQFGYNLPRTSYAQRFAGRKIANLSQAKPGDLICYSGHVAIYAGNNKIVHAANSRRGIVYGDSATFTRILAIRRIV
ncbi:MAG: C40 family peptidase [Lachnospiraceae bacterium]